MSRIAALARSGGRPALAVAISCAAALAPIPAAATVVKAMTLEQKTEASPVVVHALVERVVSEWERDESMIQTLITLKVIEAVKGDLARGERLVVRQGGGRVGDVEQTAPGLSVFEPGEEAILFLEPLGELYVPIGIGIGKYGIETFGKQKLVTHAPQVAALRHEPDGRTVVEDVAPMIPEELSAFLKRVRSYARGIPTAPRALPRKGAILKPPPALPDR
jgi:hypothetical protein